MAYDSASFSATESWLRQTIGVYTEAQERGDFLEAVLRVHTALEGALDTKLTEDEAKELSFVEKFRKVLPELAERSNVIELNVRRNAYAHPKGQFTVREYRDTARGLVDLTCAAWPQLFTSPPPLVRHPALSYSSDLRLNAPAIRETDVVTQLPREQVEAPGDQPTPPTPGRPPAAETGRKLPWGDLALGLLLLVIMLALAGVAYQIWQSPDATRDWALIPAAVALLLALLVARYLARFLRALGVGRLATPLAAVLALAALAWIPLTATVPSTVSPPVAGELPSGAGLAPTSGASPAAPGPIAVGMHVVVGTGGAPLVSRAEPGRNRPVATRFGNGTELTVVEGPVPAEGFMWWKVEGQAGSGWGVADFLAPATGQ
jgi:hypothetical protein